MSFYEKIASVTIAILLAVILVLSAGVIDRDRRPDSRLPHRGNARSDFDESVGQDFKIGPFTTVVSETASGGKENNCESAKPMLLGDLHDIYRRIASESGKWNAADSGADAFEVNEAMLTVLCNKNAKIVLVDASGDTLTLDKVPFERVIPLHGTVADLGTRVRINATLLLGGSIAPKKSDFSAEILIPDRFLNFAPPGISPSEG